MVLLRTSVHPHKVHFHPTLIFFKAISRRTVSEWLWLKEHQQGFLISHLPPWYQGFDMAGAKMRAKAQKATRVAGWAMMASSGLVSG